MACAVSSKSYYAMIAKSENTIGRLQFVSIAGCRTKSGETFRECLPGTSHCLFCILLFSLFLYLVAVVRFFYTELNVQMSQKLASGSAQILKLQNKQ
jgi:hypothetical protein